jgi:nucleoside 2-deoxyribosyltransferase
LKFKVYLAAAIHRRDEMKMVASEIEHLAEVTSRWVYASPAAGDLNEHRRLWAKRDLADVRKADVLVRFADDLDRKTVPAKLATGSRMVEMGIALERKMKVVVIGGYQCIFDYLPKVIHLKNVVELKVYLSGSFKRFTIGE